MDVISIAYWVIIKTHGSYVVPYVQLSIIVYASVHFCTYCVLIWQILWTKSVSVWWPVGQRTSISSVTNKKENCKGVYFLLQKIWSQFMPHQCVAIGSVEHQVYTLRADILPSNYLVRVPPQVYILIWIIATYKLLLSCRLGLLYYKDGREKMSTHGLWVITND